MKRCVVCGTDMMVIPGEEDRINHPTCPMFADPDGVDPLTEHYKNLLSNVIRQTEAANPRSLQRALGPSDLGHPCDRQIAYKLAEVTPVNVGADQWPTTVGTAIHEWLAKAFMGRQDWLVESPVTMDNLISGTADLYHKPSKTVLDHKTVGSDVMRKIRKNGPPPHYVVQVNLYGYGFEQSGLAVDRVGLMFYPRSGWLSDSYCWVADYDPSIAAAALSRLVRIITETVALGRSDPGQFHMINAEPHMCGFCPLYSPTRKLDPADATGCPGH